jgi:hypothetical protein
MTSGCFASWSTGLFELVYERTTYASIYPKAGLVQLSYTALLFVLTAINAQFTGLSTKQK